MDKNHFLVIDTEGEYVLKQIALVDVAGKLIYAATVTPRKSLASILEAIYPLLCNTLLVFHYALHDQRVLENSFRCVGIKWQPLRVLCTWEIAKQVLPQLPSYSLVYLCQHLNLKVDGKRFHVLFAHSASYDALFTYQLYQRLKSMKIVNPFSSNRVDNPFQEHVDFATIYQQEFHLLSTILQDIREEANRQSRGAVVIGEPGTGKTHLMMRLAKQHLKTNRLLFISQPNNEETVFYHTYCRVLESLAEKVPDTPYTQLEYLLANAFVRILQSMERVAKSVRGQAILQELEKNSLGLYGRIAKEGTKKHLDAWDYIEKNTLTWWGQTYSAAGFGQAIAQGIVRFCRYRDPQKREIVRRWLAAQVLSPEEVIAVNLPNWEEEVSRETFALEALKVLGRLSTLDEPLIFVFDQLEGLWLRHQSTLLQAFGHTIKEIITHIPNSLILLNLFPDRWQEFRRSFDGSVVERISYEVRLQHPTTEQLWDILQLRADRAGLNLDHFFNQAEVNDILNQPTIRSVLRRASQYFQAKTQQIPLPPVETLPRNPVDNSPIPSTWEERLLRLERIVEHLSNAIEMKSFLEKKEPIVTGSSEEEMGIEDIFEPQDEVALYLHTRQKELEASYDKPTIVTDSDDLGKLSTIVEAFLPLYQLTIDTLHLGKRKIPDHLLIRAPHGTFAIGFLHVSGAMFAPRIKNLNELVVSAPDTQFFLLRDKREPAITGKVSVEEIEKLRFASNGNYLLMDKQDRVNFELMYQAIIDTYNRDLEVPLTATISALITYLPSYWLVPILTGGKP